MDAPQIITLTLNPCIDKTVQVSGFRAKQMNHVLSSREDVGGKGLNVSRVLCGCGLSVLTAGIASGDALPKIKEEFDARNMPTHFVQAGGKTRVNLKIIDMQSGDMTELNETGAPVGSAYQTLLDTLVPLICCTKVLVLSGSLPPDVPKSVYHDLIVQANACGVRVVLDADGDAMRQGVQAKPFAVKPNLAELEHLAGHTLTTEKQILEQIRILHDQGVSLVCVSMGEDGAFVSKNGTVLHTKPFPIRVGSPAAAGDAMAAMLAYGVAQTLPLPEIASLACAAGTCTAEKEGTQTADFKQITDRAKDVTVTTIE